MDGRPDILAAGPGDHGRRWHGWQGRAGRLLAVLALVLLLLAAAGYPGLLAVRRGHTIDHLRALLWTVQRRQSGSPLPAAAGSAIHTFPDGSRSSFTMVAAAIRPAPRAGALTWLFLYGQHLTPGQRYGLLGGTCGGEYVTPTDWADGIADAQGDITIVAPDLPVAAQDHNVWALVYQVGNGITLGGIKGPFIGGRATVFRSLPSC